MDPSEERKLRHDIRGSLNSIKLSMEVIKTAKDREELLMFIGFVDNEVEKIDKLVDHIATPPQK